MGQAFGLEPHKQQVPAPFGYEILGGDSARLLLVGADIGNPALARKLVKGYHGYIMNKLSHALRAPGTNGKYQDSLHLVLCQKLQIIPLCLQLPEAVA